MNNQETLAMFGAALRKRAENGGRHLHHRDCIHNLPPEEQLSARTRAQAVAIALARHMIAAPQPGPNPAPDPRNP